MSQIEFWFDFSSPYAYFAALQIEEVADRHGRTVDWYPFLLGAAFRKTGMQPLTLTPMRGDYARHDWDRIARRLSAPFTLPAGFPAVSAAAGRAFYWLRDNHIEISVPFAKAIFHSCFGEGSESFSEEAVLRIALECGANVDELRSVLSSDALKSHFEGITEQAIVRGVFGSPFFFIESEPFWGADRLTLIDDWLTRGGW